MWKNEKDSKHYKGKKERGCLLNLLQEVNDQIWSKICCDDEIKRTAEQTVVCQSNAFH